MPQTEERVPSPPQIPRVEVSTKKIAPEPDSGLKK